MLTSIVYLPLEAGQAGSQQRADSQLRTHHGKKKVRMQEKTAVLSCSALPRKKAHRKERWEEEEKAGCLKKIVLKTMYVFAYECKS